MQGLLLCLVGVLLVGCGDGGHKNVPRSRTLVMDCSSLQDCSGQIKDYNSFNPFLLTGVSKTGWNFQYEPLYFYNAYSPQADNIIPWIATGHEYNDDYTEVTIHIRKGVEWSDGQPWTAHDLVFTINMLKDNAPHLSFSTDMQTWVKSAVATDDHTAKIALTKPNPRFVFSYFTNNFDNGVPIVPKHIWEGQDPQTFNNFDQEKGWPVASGPYEIFISVPAQRVWDLRPGLVGAEDGFSPASGRGAHHLSDAHGGDQAGAELDLQRYGHLPRHPAAEYTIDPRRQSQRLYVDRARVTARVSRLVASVLGV